MNLSTGFPYWLVKHGLAYDYPRLETSIKTDVVIIGGGISGALIAYYLVENNIDCILIEKRTVALGSTGASTSLLQYELDIPLCILSETIGYRPAARAYQLSYEAIDELRLIMQKIKFTDFNKSSSLYYAAAKKDEDLIMDEYEIRKKSGFGVEYLGEEELKTTYGISAANAIHSPQGGCVNAYMLTHALLQYCIKKGLQVYDRTHIEDMEYLDDGVKLKTVNGSVIETKRIVNATGYEGAGLIDKPVVTLRSRYAVTSQRSESTEFWKDSCMIRNTEDPSLFFRVTDDHRIIIGGKDEPYTDPAERDKLINAKSEQMITDFKNLFPHIDFIPEFSWAGSYCTTKDTLPYIGSYASIPHTYFAMGFGSNGITLSLVAAEIIADTLLGHQHRDAALFSFERN
ncbi:MAG: FAD-binding oxidoreductase [Chitinophagaceae bacterium]|nr:FAD-binding oxidoreductase [Chitinophagaceae bacterium]